MLAFLCLILLAVGTVGFSMHGAGRVASSSVSDLRMSAEGGDPLLLRAARGEEVERVPVWMMRQGKQASPDI